MTKLYPQLQMQPSQHLLDQLRLATRETRDSVEDITESAVLFETQQPAHAQSGDYRLAGPAFDRMQANGKKVRRWLNTDVSARPSYDAAVSLINALPEPYALRVKTALTAALGGMFNPLPAGAATVGCAGELLNGVGQTCLALAPVLEDGKIDEFDSRESLLTVRDKILATQAIMASILAHVDGALGRIEQKSHAASPLRSVK